MYQRKLDLLIGSVTVKGRYIILLVSNYTILISFVGGMLKNDHYLSSFAYLIFQLRVLIIFLFQLPLTSNIILVSLY